MTRSVRIGVFTATRAEYGLLRPVLRALDASPRLEPLLIVSGTHLSERHGLTVREIEADGQVIAARAPIPLAGDDGLSVARDMAAVTAGVAEAATSLRLDTLILLGDRTEALAAAAAAVPLRLPILHLEGGHLTAGAIDDAIRHAITKLAAVHFTAAEPYRRRLLQLGEAPERVFTVGSTAADNLMAFGRRTRAEASAALGVDLEPGFLLVALHPETLATHTPERQVGALLEALAEVRGRRLVFTLPNADAGAETIRRAIRAFVDDRPGSAHAFDSLGSERFWTALTACDAMVGNSSSGLIEAPMAGTPTVNIGERQAGRLRTPGVIDVAFDAGEIRLAIDRALSSEMQAAARDQPPPFGDGQSAPRIVKVLEGLDFADLARKPFVDRS